MNGLSMKHLRYFAALARHRHFGHAAESCSISQPALSVQMKELEALVGAPLIERKTRAIRLTRLGEALAERAEDILRQVDAIEDLARAAQDMMSGRLRIGVIPTIAPYLLPVLIQDLAVRFPGLDIRPREAVTQTLVEELLDVRLDVAVVALPVSEAGLHEEALFDEDFVLVRPLTDADKPVPPAEQLREMRLLLLEEGHCFRDQALSYCNIGQSTPRDLMEGSTLATLVQMVGVGIGVTLIPEMAVATETPSARVAVARLPAPRPKRRIGMVWRQKSPLAPYLAQMAQALRDLHAAGRIGGGGQPAGTGRSDMVSTVASATASSE
ncbi:LysR substrate-binding domain-containing protein [Lutimaribacter sp. EGI FJ00015]|uniref:LysR substrate-binding domain-containing protein n=1 Tax=Lutimaribacter degradans TaxID=2945989 RepID=A0ACC5ZSL5_9RHOB|nr:hydrogen peroxide-inducible genes activator [Lutimaribacter sp. EGI FJ00013]MCM2561319.1 LysR substrate-binding domain-containing protein [Lutimaribacter sp. EGI FJ00013]MCO0611730.1 LysR substrate-binding domain-containing protein [Lutimaribacter sp. EGI FJ00015]MCO0635148.1 LysR substrate-binding domain-containing protein [Lutimaribacter sp. EGI FJ00014]